MQTITFVSGGVLLAADLYLPDDLSRPVPAVAVGPGFAGVKEMLAPDYSRALAAAGIASLAFDYPNFGASEGSPRQHVDLAAQSRAYRDALDTLVADPRIDAARLGVWGPSLGGGHTLVTAAEHPAVRSAAAIVPFIRLPLTPPPLSLAAAVAGDLTRRAVGLSGTTVAVTGPPGAVAAMTTDGAEAWAARMAAAAPAYRNEVSTVSLLAMRRWSTARAAASIRVPLRVVLAEQDSITPPGLVRKALRTVPDVDYVTFPQTHFELFDRYGDDTRAAVVDWFVRTL